MMLTCPSRIWPYGMRRLSLYLEFTAQTQRIPPRLLCCWKAHHAQMASPSAWTEGQFFGQMYVMVRFTEDFSMVAARRWWLKI
jgi:hypothetical protein